MTNAVRNVLCVYIYYTISLLYYTLLCVISEAEMRVSEAETFIFCHYSMITEAERHYSEAETRVSEAE